MVTRIYRSAINGRLVTREYAEANPDTTTAEEVHAPVEASDEYVEHLCEVMHDAYEIAAAGAGWETQQASRKPWAEVPEANKITMRAAVRALLEEIKQ